MTEKWYEAQRRREYEAKYGKPPPNARNQAGMSRTHSDQPNRPPKSPARSASRPGSGSPGGMHRTPSQRYPSIAGSHLDVGGINAYPSPPSSSHTTTTNYYSEMSSPFSEGHGHTLGMMTPQRQAPLPGRNNSTRSTNGPIPARPSQPAPALTIYNQPTMEEGTAVDNANANTAPAPDKAGCCVIL
ncbi:hypothetical protein BDF22DRAFT_655381 [Syncephalis plumigaleata]|nr:hypothetical protein BDF22DRAFT_655381 [Syncephalis plumigaleata]